MLRVCVQTNGSQLVIESNFHFRAGSLVITTMKSSIFKHKSLDENQLMLSATGASIRALGLPSWKRRQVASYFGLSSMTY